MSTESFSQNLATISGYQDAETGKLEEKNRESQINQNIT